LLAITPSASYFQSFDWFATYWKHYGADQQLRAMIISAGSKIVGIVPLVVARQKTRLGPLRVLTYPLHGWGSFYGPIGEDAHGMLAAVLKHVDETERDWDLIDFVWVDADGADAGQTRDAFTDADLPARECPWSTSVFVEIDQGWEKYWSSRKSHWRTNVRRCERLLRERGPVEFVRYRPRGAAFCDGNPRWDLYDACEQVARRSWQGSSSTGTTLSHESVRRYLREAHQSAAEFGAVDLNLLYVNNRPAAFAYNYRYRNYVFGLRTGFDPRLATDGAGTVLQKHMIEDSCRRGDQILDLGPGSIKPKRHWQTRLAVAYRYTHYAAFSPRAQVLRVLHHLKPQQAKQPFGE
jgi:CelD/BcsL family acetyltransferase involved in cellulose biosynthesis